MSTLFSKKKNKTFLSLNTFIAKEKFITPVNILKKKDKKLVLVITTSTPIIVIKKEAFENAETSENGKDSENGNKNENLKINLVKVLYIQYLITF